MHFETVQMASSKTRTVGFTNTGSVSMNLLETDIDGNDRAHFEVSGLGQTLEPGARGEVAVVFTPQSRGLLRAVLDLGFGDGDEDQQVALDIELLGFGEEARLDFLPNPLRLEELYAGCETQEDLALENAGTLDLVLQDITFSDPDLFVLSGPELPHALSPGDQAPLVVGFTPQTAGSLNASMTVTTDRLVDEASLYTTVRVYESRVDRLTSQGGDTGGACQQAFVLTATPRPDTVIVSVADVRQEDGWSVQGATLLFEEPVACGASVEVAYEVTPPCD